MKSKTPDVTEQSLWVEVTVYHFRQSLLYIYLLLPTPGYFELNVFVHQPT